MQHMLTEVSISAPNRTHMLTIVMHKRINESSRLIPGYFLLTRVSALRQIAYFANNSCGDRKMHIVQPYSTCRVPVGVEKRPAAGILHE